MRRGEPWGEPFDPTEAVVDVAGPDATLATAAGAHPGTVLRFRPAAGSDLARALGLTADAPGSTVVACDLLDCGAGLHAVNAVVLGPRPSRLRWWHRRRRVSVEVDGRAVGSGRATTVVIANGQFVDGADLVPRGHPGDGRVEVQVYELVPGERRAMRARLPTGDHVPHPRIVQAAGRRVRVRWADVPRPAWVDGRDVPPRDQVTVEVRPGALRVLV